MNLHYKNTLNEGVAMHGHGLHVPGEVDGGPQLEISPGGVWQPKISIAQPAATCWYHSHTHGKSGEQTYRGLAGLILIDDDDTDAMDLPNRYGVDDLPVIIQDRTFDAEGRLLYALMEAEEDGWYGDTVVVNGAIAPLAKVPAGKVRLRILNGANARFYFVAFADGRTFHKIASDGGLLPSPVPLTSMEMSPGERCEIIVDMSDGTDADLLMLFEDLIDDEGDGTSEIDLSRYPAALLAASTLTLQVDPSLAAQRAPLPETLTTITRPREDEIVRTRDFHLTMQHSAGHGAQAGHGGHAMMDMAINGASMDLNVINERVQIGVWERWRIRSDQGAHPFHAHGCSFLIEQSEGEAASPDQQGWKDIVVLDDDDWSEIVVRFDHKATEQFPYMYHCHILEHEDRGMMGQFTVT
ncbi:MAG: multicopper oxidase domain-containing protein [Pseudomonadota bacterium]